MPTYTHVATYDAPVEEVSAHTTTGAFRRIMPEWEGIKPLEAGRLVNDATTRFRVSLGPLRPMWVARHYDVVAGEVFNDVMEKGPFGAWDHEHRFVPTGDNTSEIRRHHPVEIAAPYADVLDGSLHREGPNEPNVCLPNPPGPGGPPTDCTVRRPPQTAGARERFNRTDRPSTLRVPSSRRPRSRSIDSSLDRSSSRCHRPTLCGVGRPNRRSPQGESGRL